MAKELQREISRIVLYELTDPRLGFITITRAEPASDLQSAKVFFTIIGDEKARKICAMLLNNAANYIQNLLGKRIKMRYIPKLSFHFDESVEEEEKVYALLNKISRENAPKGKPVKK